MESTTLQWKEPLAARRWLADCSRPKRLGWRIWEALYIPIVVVAAIYGLVRADYFSFMLWLAMLLTTLNAKSPHAYTMSHDGFKLHSPVASKIYRWQEIEWYRITPDVPGDGLGILDFKVNRSGKPDWAQIYFDTREVDMVQLREMLDHYLPSKDISSSASDQS